MSAVQASVKTILIVEDEPDTAEVMSFLLEEQGYATTTAGDGLEALMRLESEPQPALVILDLSMPRMDGRELLRRMRQDGRLQRIPVVVCSASASWFPAAANATIIKPVNFDTLLKTVRSLLA